MKNNLKIFFAIVLFCMSVLVFGVVLYRAIFYMPSDEIVLPASLKTYSAQEIQNIQTKKIIYSALYPKQLRIPSIKVNAKVQYVGITKNGNMATPSNFTDVGWFKYGTLPGDTGSAVIAGHVDNGLAFPGVFKNLVDIKKGEDIYLDVVGGSTIHFRVTNIKTYDFNAPTEEIFNQNDGKFLKLITCTGTWMDYFKTHDKRLVVTAERI